MTELFTVDDREELREDGLRVEVLNPPRDERPSGVTLAGLRQVAV